MSGPADRGGAPRPMSVDEAIETRRSVRGFLPDPVPEATVRHILEVAARAPSGTNIQPWQVYVVAGEARDRVVSEVLAARDRNEGSWHYTYYPKKWREPYLGRRRKLGWDLYGLLGIVKGDKEGMSRHFGHNFTFFDAPVGLFFALDEDMELGSWLDIGMFIENVMIAARGQGLDTCPQAAWVEYHQTVHRVIGIPDTQKLVCGMALGYEDKSAPANRLVTVREPVDMFAKFLGF
jgi:nitroreductase